MVDLPSFSVTLEMTKVLQPWRLLACSTLVWSWRIVST